MGEVGDWNGWGSFVNKRVGLFRTEKERENLRERSERYQL